MTRLKGSDATRMYLVLGTLLGALLIAVAVFATRKPAVKPAPVASAANFNLNDASFIGKADAPVSVVLVEDFKCPVCKNFTDTIEPELVTKYVDTGKAKIYTVIWPFLSEVVGLPTNDSKFAAQALKCVLDQTGNEGAEIFKSIVFRAQEDENKVWATKARLKELVGNVDSVDQAKFDTCLDTDATLARVDADKKQVTEAGITGTPTVFVNGKQVMLADGSRGSYLLDDISKAIDAALK